MDESHVYVRASTVLSVLISTQTFRRALTASVDSCAEIKSAPAFSGVTKSGRVWRKVPGSDAMLGVCLLHCDTLHVVDAVVCLVEVLTVIRVPVFLLMFERCLVESGLECILCFSHV